MAIYAIIRQPGAVLPVLGAAIQSAYPGEALTVEEGIWFVSARGTAREVSEKIGITRGPENGEVGSAIVIEAANNYWGRATGEIWSWLKSRTEATIG